MPAILENSAVASGLKQGSFHSNPKEKEMQEGKVIVQGGFTNSQGKKRREKEGYT